MADERDKRATPDEDVEPLINPAPGDMPVDPPIRPLPIGPLDDISSSS